MDFYNEAHHAAVEAIKQKKEMIAAVRSHAGKNYETDGWDFVIEAWDDSDIARIIDEDRCKSPEAAIKACHERCRLHDERRKEVRAEIW